MLKFSAPSDSSWTWASKNSNQKPFSISPEILVIYSTKAVENDISSLD